MKATQINYIIGFFFNSFNINGLSEIPERKLIVYIFLSVYILTFNSVTRRRFFELIMAKRGL